MPRTRPRSRTPRPDGDYALSWIRREGKGRVFYEAHGHNEKIYANTQILEHVLAGMQYVLGDLQADDSPSAKSKLGVNSFSKSQTPKSSQGTPNLQMARGRLKVGSCLVVGNWGLVPLAFGSLWVFFW